MKLGYHTGYWSSGPPAGVAEAVIEADRLGFDSVWTAEAYGSDALTPLAWWGAATKNIKLPTNIMQMSARTPAAAGMAAITLDHLSRGRFVVASTLCVPPAAARSLEFGHGQNRARHYRFRTPRRRGGLGR